MSEYGIFQKTHDIRQGCPTLTRAYMLVGDLTQDEAKKICAEMNAEANEHFGEDDSDLYFVEKEQFENSGWIGK